MGAENQSGNRVLDTRDRQSPFHRNGSASRLFDLSKIDLAAGAGDASSLSEADRRVRAAAKRLGITKDAAQTLASLGFISMTPTPGGADEITNLYRDSWVVFACLKAWQDAIQGIPWVLAQSSDPEAKPVPESDPLAKLLNAPTPGLPMGWLDVVKQDVVNLLLCGESVWFLSGAGGRPLLPASNDTWRYDEKIKIPTQFVPVIGRRVRIDRRATDGLAYSYSFSRAGGSEAARFAPSSVVAHTEYDPDDYARGIGRGEVAHRKASIAFQAERFTESVMRSGGPGAFLVYSKEELGTENESILQEKVDEATRSQERIGGLQVLTGDVEVVANPATPKAMLTRETELASRDSICSTMGVPPPVIGIFDRATYNNVHEAYRQFYFTIRAMLDAYAMRINQGFFARLDDAVRSKYRLRADYSQVSHLREDESDKIKLAIDGASKRIGLSFNDIATMLGVKAKLPANGNEIPEPETPAEDAGEKPKDPEAEDDKSLRTRALSSQAAREAYGQAYHERVTGPWETKLATNVAAWFAKYQRAQMRRVRRFAEVGPHHEGKAFIGVQRELLTDEQIDTLLALNHKKWQDLLEAAVGDALVGVYSAAISDMALELAVVGLPMTEPSIQVFLATQRIQIAEGVESTLARRVRVAILEAVSEATTGADLQAAIVEVLPELSSDLERVFGSREARAATIARTEIGKASSNARVRQMQEAGVERIEWLTQRDGHVRESHIELDGQVRAIGMEFKPNLRWPDDENGPPEEVINCRCLPLAVLEK